MSSSFRFVWDGNVLLHETFKKDNSEHTELTTWVFEGFVPTAKLVNGKAYSIISDHLGTPILAVDSDGMEVWNRQLDIYGRVRKEYKHSSLEDEVFPFVPFLYQGQYYDFETNLAYNRFRYYSPETGAYISQDPIDLDGNNPNIYAYVQNPNIWIDVFGLLNENRDPQTGRFAKNPNPISNRHCRKTEYPSTFRAGIVDKVIKNKTGEDGIIRDKYDKPINKEDVTIEHKKSVSEHWNEEGHNQSRAKRNDWYNELNNLDILSKKQNSSEGAKKPQFKQETGCNYSK